MILSTSTEKVDIIKNTFINLSRYWAEKKVSDVEGIGEFQENKRILEQIKASKREWSNSINNFEFALDQDLIDYYTYNIKAQELKYSYLIKLAKKKGMKVTLNQEVNKNEE